MDKTYDDLDANERESLHAVSDPERRKLLLVATTAVGGALLGSASLPFIASMNPSERAKAAGAPVEADLSQLAPGAQATFEWRGQPVWVLHRTDDMLETLQDPRHLAKLSDPKSDVKSQQPLYAQNPLRSVRPEYLIALGLCADLPS